MIIGFVKVEKGAVNTHRDSYLLENPGVISVRRPLAGAGMIAGPGSTSFGLSFSDLLYPGELLTVAVITATALLIGSQVAQLKPVYREPKGTELAGGVSTLQNIRTAIVTELRALPALGGVR